jgi:hypothetical protein
MTLVSTVTVGAGGAASIDFTGIPQTGTDLVVVLSGRLSGGSFSDAAQMQFNSDTATNYSSRDLRGDGSGATSANISALNRIMIQVAADTATSNTFGNAQVYITNYTSSVAKSVSVDNVTENNATAARADIRAARWSGTAAITSLKINGSFMQYSTASLYKITKGSGGATVS